MDHLIPSEAQLGDALRAHLSARGMTYRDAEKELGISSTTLCRLAHGARIRSDHYIHLVKKIWFEPLFRVD